MLRVPCLIISLLFMVHRVTAILVARFLLNLQSVNQDGGPQTATTSTALVFERVIESFAPLEEHRLDMVEVEKRDEISRHAWC